MCELARLRGHVALAEVSKTVVQRGRWVVTAPSGRFATAGRVCAWLKIAIESQLYSLTVCQEIHVGGDSFFKAQLAASYA